MTWIDDLYTGIKRVLWEGVLYPQHQRINFLGSGVQVADNPSLGATDVTIEIDLDDLDGDRIHIDWDPTNYTPDASPPEALDENDLTAHLAGIDNELGEIEEALEGAFEPTAHAPTHLPSGSDPLTCGTPATIGSANAAGSATYFANGLHVHNHGALAGGDRHAVATESVAGFMSAADKAKLDGLEGGSEAGAWPESCALVFDFTKPATVAVNAAITTGDLASGFTCSPPGAVSPYTEIDTPTGNEYPVNVINSTPGVHYVVFAASVYAHLGYAVVRVCAEAAHHSWIRVGVVGLDAYAHFNLTTGEVGTSSGAYLLGAAITSDGDGGYVCDLLIDNALGLTVGIEPRVYICDADASTQCTGWASGPAILLKQFDLLHGTAGMDVVQKTVERIESVGSRRTTCAWQDENEESQPPLLDGYTPLLPTPGALFAGNQGGYGINAKRLRILDPAGAADLVRQLSAVAHPWTLYVVCAFPTDDTAERVLFSLGSSDSRCVFALLYDGDVILRSHQGGAAVDASIAQPADTPGDRHLLAFYYGGGTLRVGADDLLGSIVTDTAVSAEPYTEATLGGSGNVDWLAYSECRALMQIAIFVPERCDPLSTDDMAIRAKLATDFTVTTLLGT